MTAPIGLLGVAGQALELTDYCGRSIAFRALSREYLEPGTEIVPLDDPPPSCRGLEVVAAVGAPGAKRSLVSQWPGDRFATIVAADSHVAVTSVIGAGSIVAPNASVMAATRLGRHVLVNTGSVVSHECVIGDFVTVSPGAMLGGRCRVADGAFIGIGATIRDGVTVGEGAVIGAGAVVLTDVASADVVVGVPARAVKSLDDWLWRI